MKNINIPEPCSEDFSKMTPNEKGAFCQKCALDVYDFTNKSADEIRQVLTINMANPVCMKVQPKQLDELNADFSAWKIQNNHSYQRAWVFTLLVVFGMTLFSCEEDEEPVVKEYQKIGQSFLNQDEEKVIDPVNEDQTINKNEQQAEKAIIEIESPHLAPEVHVMGTAVYDPRDNEVVVLDEVVISDKARILDYPKIERAHQTAGVPIISRDFNDYLLQTHDGVIVDSVELNAEPKITGLVYPNPASNETTLRVTMPKRGKADIELSALNGQKIRTLHSGRIRKGESEYPIDLTDLETGMYLVTIYSGNLKETIKFSKI